MTHFYVELLEGPGRGRTFTFSKERVRVGRAPDNDLVLVDGSVSRYHCEIRLRNNMFELCDAHSTNGVKLNGRKLVDVAQLRELDMIELGRLRLRFHHGDLPEASGLSSKVDASSTSLMSTTQMLPAEGETDADAEAIAREYQSPTQLYSSSISEKVLQKRQEQRSQRSSIILLATIAVFAIAGIVSMVFVSQRSANESTNLPMFTMDAEFSKARFGTTEDVTHRTPGGLSIDFQSHLMRGTFSGSWFAEDGDVEFAVKLNGVRVENLLVRLPNSVQNFSYSLPRSEIREGRNVLELVALNETATLQWWFESLRILESATGGDGCAGEAESRARLIGLLEGEIVGKPGSMYNAVEELTGWATTCSATLSAARLNQTRSWIDRGKSWLASRKRKAIFEAERALRLGNRDQAISILRTALEEFPALGTSDREDLKAKIRQLSIP